MPTRIRYNDGYDVDVEADGDLGNNNMYVNDTVVDVKIFHSHTPLQYFHVRTVGDHLVYEFLAEDGRRWEQNLKNVAGVGWMTFDVGDYWKLEEFVYQRSIRDKIFELIKQYRLTRFDVDF